MLQLTLWQRSAMAGASVRDSVAHGAGPPASPPDLFETNQCYGMAATNVWSDVIRTLATLVSCRGRIEPETLKETPFFGLETAFVGNRYDCAGRLCLVKSASGFRINPAK